MVICGVISPYYGHTCNVTSTLTGASSETGIPHIEYPFKSRILLFGVVYLGLKLQNPDSYFEVHG